MAAPLQSRFRPRDPNAKTRTGKARGRKLLKDVAAAIGDPTLTEPRKHRNLRERLTALLEEEGMGLRQIVRAHKKQLEARRGLMVNGKIEYVPDCATRQKAISDAYQAHGVFETKPEPPRFGPIVLHLTLEQIRQLEEIRQGPLPANAVIPIPSDALPLKQIEVGK